MRYPVKVEQRWGAEEFPWFKEASVSEILNVEWPQLHRGLIAERGTREQGLFSRLSGRFIAPLTGAVNAR